MFETRWKANESGRMSLYVSRKSGYAHVEANPEKLELVSNFHREKALSDRLWCLDSLQVGGTESNIGGKSCDRLDLLFG